MSRRDPATPTPVLIAWGARALAVLGGMALFGLVRPAATVPSSDTDHAAANDPTAARGRGTPSAPASRRARKEGHETTDMSGRLMVRLVAGLGSMAAIVIALMYGFVTYLNRADQSVIVPYTPQQVAVITPPLPHLQAEPLNEIAQLRQHEDTLLNGYGYNDPAHTAAHIPIARAMTLIAGHPLDTAP